MKRHHHRIVVDQQGVHGIFNPAQLKEKRVTIWLEGKRQIRVAPDLLASQEDSYQLPVTFAELEDDKPPREPVSESVKRKSNSPDRR